jgi:hypothetical protein
VTEWVTGAAILAQAGVTSPATGDVEWSEACAAAVSAGFDARLVDAVWPGPPIEPPVLPAELTWSALTAGVEAYKRREATFGITGYVDLQGAAIRVARDYLEAVAPILERYATRGLA